MNERTSEWMYERMNEWTSEWTNERVNDVNEWIIEGICEAVDIFSRRNDMLNTFNTECYIR